MADDKKVIFSMVGVNKIYQESDILDGGCQQDIPPAKTGFEKHIPVIFLRSERWRK